MSTQKSVALTREEVKQLIDLVEANPVILSKATNASNNQLKEAAWLNITNTFNSIIASCPRKPEQLRLKWENLKKAARKRSTKIRMNNLKTGGGKPDYIPPDDTLEKVSAILGPTCDGYSVQFGGDAEMEVTERDEEKESVADSEPILISFLDTEKPVAERTPAIEKNSPLRTPQNKKFFFTSATSKGKLKRQIASDDMKASIIARNRAIAEYYEAKKKQEEVLAALKKKKMELEILELEKKVCPNIWNEDNTK